MNLLPQMGSENLDQRNLQGWQLSVHENTSQVELDLETNIDIGTVDSRRPPEGKSTVGNLVQS